MRKRNAMGTRIRELREAAGVSLDALATTIGTSASHLSRVERGLSAPGYPIVVAIARELDISLRELDRADREQAVVDADLVDALTAAGMDRAVAQDIQARISTPARRALLDAIGAA